MAKQTINLGTAPTGVGGDTPRSAFTKTQGNFDELYAAFGSTGSPPALPGALPIANGGTGNTTGAATKLAAAAILGTVLQSGGVPTGAILEKVVNANGEATKFADGRLICTGPIADFTVAAGAVATVSPAGVFPVLFADTAYTYQAFGNPQSSFDVYGYTGTNSKLNWSATSVYRNGPTAQTIGNGRYIAIGRWF